MYKYKAKISQRQQIRIEYGKCLVNLSLVNQDIVCILFNAILIK